MLWNLTRDYNAGLDPKALYLVSKKTVHWTKTETVRLQVKQLLYSDPSRSMSK